MIIYFGDMLLTILKTSHTICFRRKWLSVCIVEQCIEGRCMIIVNKSEGPILDLLFDALKY